MNGLNLWHPPAQSFCCYQRWAAYINGVHDKPQRGKAVILKLFCSRWLHQNTDARRRMGLYMRNSNCNVKGKILLSYKLRTYLRKSLSLPDVEIGNGNEGWSLLSIIQESYQTGNNSLLLRRILPRLTQGCW